MRTYLRSFFFNGAVKPTAAICLFISGTRPTSFHDCALIKWYFLIPQLISYLCQIDNYLVHIYIYIEIGHCRAVAFWLHVENMKSGLEHTHLVFTVRSDYNCVLSPGMWPGFVERGALPGHVALLSHTEPPSDFWKAEGEMCKANHAAERSYAQCEITVNNTSQINVQCTSWSQPAIISLRLKGFMINVIQDLAELCVLTRSFISFSCLVFRWQMSLEGKIKIFY